MSSIGGQRVELGSVEVGPQGQTFVLSFLGENCQMHRMELPSWAVHQLMRLLPRLDAALLQARDEASFDLVAYPVVQWSVERTGDDRSVALSLRTDRLVESAYLLQPDAASSLRDALAQALTEPPRTRRPQARAAAAAN